MDHHRQVEILERHLKKLKEFMKKVDRMDKCHIVTHPLAEETDLPEGVVGFQKTEDGFIHGIDAPGDWNSGFKELKESIKMIARIQVEEAQKALDWHINQAQSVQSRTNRL